MSAEPRDVVNRYFRCMQAGRGAAEELVQLFADDAVYVEPFTGERLRHEGRAAIEQALRGGWDAAPPDLRLAVDRVDADGDTVVTTWTCTSPVFPHPMRGRDRCVVRDGRIHSLDVTFLP